MRLSRHRRSPIRAGSQSKIVLAVVVLLVVTGIWGLSDQRGPFTDRPAEASPSLIGYASVIDGDTIEIRGQRVRLHGIDAPENNQLCEAEGKHYRCGSKAALALADLLRLRTVACERVSLDRYGRIVAKCAVGGRDIGGWMVQHGWATAYERYSDEYLALEREAQAGRRGIWAGTFARPEQWRREQGRR